MQTESKTPADPGVVVTVAKACLIGRRYCVAGETITVPAGMADKVCRQKIAAFGQLSLAEALAETGTKQNAEKTKPAKPKPAPAPEAVQDAPEDVQDVEAPDDVEIPEAFEDVGLAGRVADLLRAADPPIETVGQLRDLIADGFDPESINGIGPASAESIRAAIANLG